MGSFADAMQVAPAKARDSRKPEIGIRRGGRVVERMDGRVSERGQHNVIAVAAVVVDRDLVAGSPQSGRLVPAQQIDHGRHVK